MGLGEVRLRDVGRVLMKEVAVGLILGVIMAIVAYGRAELLSTGPQVAMVVALTIAAICVWSATVAAVRTFVSTSSTRPASTTRRKSRIASSTTPR